MPDLENRMTTVERRLDRVFDSLDIFATNQIRLDEALATLVDAQIRSQQQYRDTQQQFRDTQQQFRDTDEKIAKQFRDTQEQYRRTDERIAKLVSGTQEQFRQTDERIDKLLLVIQRGREEKIQ